MWKEFQNWKPVRFHNRKQFRSLELLALHVGGFVCSSRSQVLSILTCLNSLVMLNGPLNAFGETGNLSLSRFLHASVFVYRDRDYTT